MFLHLHSANNVRGIDKLFEDLYVYTFYLLRDLPHKIITHDLLHTGLTA